MDGNVLEDYNESECLACLEGVPKHECSFSKRKCGHHCNHSWTHDYCCWCNKEIAEV